MNDEIKDEIRREKSRLKPAKADARELHLKRLRQVERLLNRGTEQGCYRRYTGRRDTRRLTRGRDDSEDLEEGEPTLAMVLSKAISRLTRSPCGNAAK